MYIHSISFRPHELHSLNATEMKVVVYPLSSSVVDKSITVIYGLK